MVIPAQFRLNYDEKIEIRTCRQVEINFGVVSRYE